MQAEPHHVSVLPAEVEAVLAVAAGETWVDATVGAGGHARRIAECVQPGGRLIGLDQDAGMLALARQRLDGLPVTLVQANFEQLPQVLGEQGIVAVDGVLADLGICSDQLDDPQRGLSFQHDGPLDMRLDPERGEPASELVNRLPERELADVLYQYGEERLSRRIARRIVEAREKTAITTTAELAAIVRRCVPRSPGRGGIDPATRTFQALRIAVNDELGVLERLLRSLPVLVKPGGRVAIISFHSLEDRMVKHAFRDDPRWAVITRKPIQAGEDELARNPRARSAKLRAARRIEPSAEARQ